MEKNVIAICSKAAHFYIHNLMTNNYELMAFDQDTLNKNNWKLHLQLWIFFLTLRSILVSESVREDSTIIVKYLISKKVITNKQYQILKKFELKIILFKSFPCIIKEIEVKNIEKQNMKREIAGNETKPKRLKLKLNLPRDFFHLSSNQNQERNVIGPLKKQKAKDLCKNY